VEEKLKFHKRNGLLPNPSHAFVEYPVIKNTLLLSFGLKPVCCIHLFILFHGLKAVAIDLCRVSCHRLYRLDKIGIGTIQLTLASARGGKAKIS
jgi:hypothetical protein